LTQPKQVLGAVHGNQDAMDGFARVNAGVTSPAGFFSEANIGGIIAAAAAADRASQPPRPDGPEN